MSTDILINKQRPANILLVEDNYGDVILTRRAFQEAKIVNKLYVASTGEEAVSMLRKEDEWKDFNLPDLILLDLNLPQMHGQEVLEIIKKEQSLKHIPVIILSSSRADNDVVKSYNLHANGYVVKPVSLDNFHDVVKKLEQFWFTLVVMPDYEAVQHYNK